MTKKNLTEITQINDNDNKITSLENIISDELEKSDTNIDTDLIEECLDYIMELKFFKSESSEAFKYGVTFDEDELEAKAKSIIEKNHGSKKSKKPSFIRMRRKALIAAACMLIYMSAMTVIAYSFDQEGVLNNYLPEILKLGRGESLIIGNTEYRRTTDDMTYSDVHDLLEKESIDSILFPSVLENYSPYVIKEVVGYKLLRYEFIYNEEYTIYYGIFESPADSPDFPERYSDYDVINVNGIDYYVKSYEPDTPYYAYFTDGHYEYMVKCDTYEIIIEMIESITVYN